MSRYRPPQKPGSPYITRAGFENLRAELDYLWQTKRPEVTNRVSAAAAEGDRSENAEYIYSKKQLREIDRRIRFLQKRLDVLKIVDRPPSNQLAIFFGAMVTVEDENANEFTYRIVGSDEFDTKKNWISVDSPMAKALLGKKVDDEVLVKLPIGENIFYIIAIKY